MEKDNMLAVTPPIIPIPVPMPVPSDPRLRREFFLNLDKQHTKGAIIGTIILLGASILLFALAFYFVKIRPGTFYGIWYNSGIVLLVTLLPLLSYYRKPWRKNWIKQKMISEEELREIFGELF